jgi:hypothetical protein
VEERDREDILKKMNISPPMVKADIQRGRVLIPNRDRTILTKGGFGFADERA